MPTLLTAEQEMRETLENIFEKRGYNGNFRHQYLDDDTVKNSIMDVLAKNFVYEGLGPNRVMHFRKIHNGRLSKPYTVDEILSHYVENPAVLDMGKWKDKKAQAKKAIKAEMLKEFDTPEEKMTSGQRAALSSRVDRAYAEQLTMFSNKTLPRYNQEQLLADFAKEDPGITKPRGVRDLTFRGMVAQVPKNKLEELNSLHSWDPYFGSPEMKTIRDYEPEREHWAVEVK